MNKLLAALTLLVFISCDQKTQVDLLVHNATIYTVDSMFTTVEAMAISGGRIIETGTSAALLEKYEARDRIDVGGKFIFPGFIDAHAHFVGYGHSLKTVDLVGTNSWQEVIDRVKVFAKDHKDGWITGRGWDQNDWVVKEFPDNTALDSFPFPVLLSRIDGHAAIANKQALQMAGITAATKVTGGDVILKNGVVTGVLIDNAIELVAAKIPAPTRSQFREALMEAERNCFAVGLTTIDDCGLSAADVERIKDMQSDGQLRMRMYVMLSDEKANYEYLEKKGTIKTDRLHVRGFKVYGDGALGSRGACLLRPYSDQPGHLGFLLSDPAHFDSVASHIAAKGWQMCTHAIGDSGNRTILNVYGKYLKTTNDLRWRIEHAQVVHPNDFELFGKYSIIPSVQPTHATSDMYWAGDRLGADRIKGAYAYKQLLRQNGWIPLGTDFPVEDISPFKTFYAAVIRKDAKGWPEGGYQMENALTREEALRGMTIWAAKSNFEEKEKGSLEKGKWADFIILDKDLLQAGDDELLQVSVLETYIGGQKVYEKETERR